MMVRNPDWLRGASVAALFLAAACGSDDEGVSLGGDGGLPPDNGAVEANGVIPPTPEQLAALCAAPEAGEKLFTQETLGQATAELVGAWFRCPDAAYDAAPDAAITALGVTSVEFDASGEVYVLREQGGRLQRGATSEYQGSWIVELDQWPSAYEPSGVVGMSVSIDGVRLDKARLFLAEGPKKFRYNGVTYVAAPGSEGGRAPAPTPSPTGLSRASIANLCPAEVDFGSYYFPANEEYQPAVVGVWAVCRTAEGVPVFGTDNDVVAVELTADGKFYKLYDQEGALVRGQGFGRVGEWDIRSAAETRPGLQLRIDGFGTMSGFPGIQFLSGPDLFMFDLIGISSYFDAGPPYEGPFVVYARVPAP